MNFPEFFGGSNSAFSLKAACERTVNLTLEKIESGAGEAEYVFYRSPGLVLNAGGGSIDGSPMRTFRGAVELNDHYFTVVDSIVIDWVWDGTTLAVARVYDSFADDGLPAVMAIDKTRCLVVSQNILYAIEASDLTFGYPPATLPALTFTPIWVTKINNYWVALADDLSQFYFSDDGLTWDPADVQTAEADANLLQAMCVLSQQLVIFGSRVTQTFYVGTNPDAPFVPRTEAVIMQGIKARHSVRVIGDSMYWLAQSKTGQVTVQRSAGGPGSQAVSSIALENTLREYESRVDGTIADAIGMSYSFGKKDFYRLTFPTANATWELDISNGRWIETPYWNSETGEEERHRCNTMTAAFGRIFAGDRANGRIYEFTQDAYTDNGDAIVWLRRCPHLIKEHKRVAYDKFYVGCEMGVGLDVASDQAGYDPQMAMRWSDDGGRTFSNIYWRSMGRSGEYSKTVPTWDRLGEGKDRIYEISGSDPVKVALTSAGFEAQVLKT